MKSFKIFLLTMCALWIAGTGSQIFADEYSQTISVFKKSSVVQPFFQNAYGYAVFPTVGKGGIVVGGAFGKGKVYRQGTLTGHATLSKVTVGFQLGGQAFSEIIFFQDNRAYDEFTSGIFEFDASASAVVITAGAQAKAGSEGGTASASAGPDTGTQASLGYRKGVAVFVHTKGGLMYEATIGGQRFDFTPL
jgi:lipid-binding SYLF domain-containing protein